MKKEELVSKILDLLEEVDCNDKEEFSDEEIEDLIVESGLPITYSHRR